MFDRTKFQTHYLVAVAALTVAAVCLLMILATIARLSSAGTSSRLNLPTPAIPTLIMARPSNPLLVAVDVVTLEFS